MRKRARNHKAKVHCEICDKITGTKGSPWKEWGFDMHKFGFRSDYNYEPQGKREARKFFTKVTSKTLRDIAFTK